LPAVDRAVQGGLCAVYRVLRGFKGGVVAFFEVGFECGEVIFGHCQVLFRPGLRRRDRRLGLVDGSLERGWIKLE